MEIEEQKQKQLELLEQIEQQKLRLETDRFRAQLEEEKKENATDWGRIQEISFLHRLSGDTNI